MGYTHYYKLRYPTKDVDTQYQKSLTEIKKLFKLLPDKFETAGNTYNSKIVLNDYNGVGKPEFKKTHISFNGNRRLEEDHETFYFEPKFTDFEFCKTARKPYDFFVCLCLLSLATHIESFTFSSDGDIDDWKPAIEFYQEHIGPVKQEIINFI